MTQKKPIVALIYDYDGTLSPGNMQEFGFIQAVGKTAEEFWRMSDSIAIGQDASNVLAYMKLMFDEAKRNGIKLRREDFQRFGQNIQLFDGVREWFRLVNSYGEQHGVKIEHYINSSGLTESSLAMARAPSGSGFSGQPFFWPRIQSKKPFPNTLSTTSIAAASGLFEKTAHLTPLSFRIIIFFVIPSYGLTL